MSAFTNAVSSSIAARRAPEQLQRAGAVLILEGDALVRRHVVAAVAVVHVRRALALLAVYEAHVAVEAPEAAAGVGHGDDSNGVGWQARKGYISNKSVLPRIQKASQQPTEHASTTAPAMKPQPASIPLAPILKKVMPLCFLTGMAMETFMVKTGFCASPAASVSVAPCARTHPTDRQTLSRLRFLCADDIATAAEGERRQQRYEERKELLKKREAGASPWDEIAKFFPEQRGS